MLEQQIDELIKLSEHLLEHLLTEGELERLIELDSQRFKQMKALFEGESEQELSTQVAALNQLQQLDEQIKAALAKRQQNLTKAVASQRTSQVVKKAYQQQ